MDIEIRHTARSSRTGRTDRVAKPRVTLGRRPGNDVTFDVNQDVKVSGFHAEVWVEGRDLKLIDKGSVNGTYVNGSQIQPNVPVTVTPNDRVSFGAEGPEMLFAVSATASAPLPPPPETSSSPGGEPPKKLIGENTLKREIVKAVEVARNVSQDEANKVRVEAGKAQKKGLVVTLVAIVVLGGVGSVAYVNVVRRVDDLAKIVAKTRAEIDQRLEAQEKSFESELSSVQQSLKSVHKDRADMVAEVARTSAKLAAHEKELEALRRNGQIAEGARLQLQRETEDRMGSLRRELREKETKLQGAIASAVSELNEKTRAIAEQQERVAAQQDKLAAKQEDLEKDHAELAKSLAVERAAVKAELERLREDLDAARAGWSRILPRARPAIFFVGGRSSTATVAGSATCVRFSGDEAVLVTSEELAKGLAGSSATIAIQAGTGRAFTPAWVRWKDKLGLVGIQCSGRRVPVVARGGPPALGARVGAVGFASEVAALGLWDGERFSSADPSFADGFVSRAPAGGVLAHSIGASEGAAVLDEQGQLVAVQTGSAAVLVESAGVLLGATDRGDLAGASGVKGFLSVEARPAVPAGPGETTVIVLASDSFQRDAAKAPPFEASATAVADFFQQDGHRPEKTTVVALVGENATRAKLLEKIAAATGETLIVYVAGPTVRRANGVFLALQGADLEKLDETALGAAAFADAIKGSKVARKLVLVDAGDAPELAVGEAAIAAASKNEPVLVEEGTTLFANVLLSGLRGRAASSDDTPVASDELAAFVAREVSRRAGRVGARETPVVVQKGVPFLVGQLPPRTENALEATVKTDAFPGSDPSRQQRTQDMLVREAVLGVAQRIMGDLEFGIHQDDIASYADRPELVSEKAFEARPENGRTFVKAKVHVWRGKLAKALDEDHRSPAWLKRELLVGKGMLSQGDSQKARWWFEHVLRLSSNAPEIASEATQGFADCVALELSLALEKELDKSKSLCVDLGCNEGEKRLAVIQEHLRNALAGKVTLVAPGAKADVLVGRDGSRKALVAKAQEQFLHELVLPECVLRR